MSDATIINLSPHLDQVLIKLESEDVSIDLVPADSNIVLELSPALFMNTNFDNTDYLMYYTLSKG